jgi:hypothetical protein
MNPSVIRDIVIIVALGLIGAFCVGGPAAMYLFHTRLLRVLALGCSILVFMTGGFTLSGYLAVGNRWRHLALVAAGVWLVDLAEVAFSRHTLIDWMKSGLFVIVMMSLGGMLSHALRRSRRSV